ncbi:phosphoesterase family-domain-containing protein [Glomus cerebriforme]|uniref:Phosphoesterase family-domain-containing protein n=1 Tax=Glomus cerebriforme TaxID=658196 RepID=A0A397TJA5_9GLOM|nr:phosphoesterase family-domain-containing protein [Glomus cerebriforme]
MKFSKFITLFMVISCIYCMKTTGQIVKGKYFDRLFLITFENTDYATAAVDPYLVDLSTRQNGILLSNFFAVDHPSEPNYVAHIFGSTDGILDDEFYNITGNNIVDLLEEKNISWKAYMEDFPSDCYTGMLSPVGHYARRHNPFISMVNINSDPIRCAKIVNANQLDTDISTNSLPQFAYYTPNVINDAHDTNLTFAMTWFKNWLEPKLQEPAFTTNTLIFITFDESESKIVNQNQIFSSLLGSPVQPNENHNDDTFYTHYSLAKTIEDNWNLNNLGKNDTTANPFTKFLVQTPIKNACPKNIPKLYFYTIFVSILLQGVITKLMII